ncbi:uncharacterized protein EAF02_002539 [Botrytis sinoallii]|uniref:uncharacterized protein n=1 Tax=Botrytis sinoallii TaxID=1463999 RepID=UPI001902A315|nr:uncharacterized protein EAF02_002539 [Botrytis sinoallii]KAF7890124.1 hypothetical protein EAF02_002539 [Botrytis sinoallii]
MQADERRFAIILGAGAAGIIQGYAFLREDVLPLEEFHILDRNESFGGVWWSNTYPGAACDIPSNEYCITEIQQYFEGFALKYQLDKSTTFNTEIVSATWDDSRLLWFVQTQDSKSSSQKIWCYNVLVSAAGAFGMPKKADIAGLKTFKGEQWHLGSWPKDDDLKNKSVAVIGTGQSAGQAIPSIYPEVKQLTVYQRSPGHCLPRNDVSISGSRNYRWFGMAQFGFVAKRIFHIGSWWQKFVVGMAKNHLYNQISDDNLRRKLESKSHFGCKRPLKLDTWYPIFTNNNVDLVTDPVTGLTEDGILSREAEGGREIERKMDVLIWDTGYNSNKFGTPVPTRAYSIQK